VVSRSFLGSVVLLFCVLGSALAQAPVQIGAATSSQAFSENKGQWNSQARFLARSPGLNLWVTGEGLVMDYHKFVPAANQKHVPNNRLLKGTTFGDVVRMTFTGATPSVISGLGKLSGDENYFIGNDSSHWASSVHRFSEAKAEQLYPGVAVRYYFDQGAPRYDILASSGADLSQIGIKVEGVQGMRVLENGDLELLTPYGLIEEKGLRAYQESSGVATQIPCRMVVDNDIVRFDLGSYDSSRPVVVDPLVFSTYLGGSTSDDGIQALKLDSSKNVVVTGLTFSTDFPVTTGAYQKTDAGTYNEGTNIFVSKLNPTGKTLLASTYLGGSGQPATSTVYGDISNGLALDASGNAVVVGITYSTNFPVTTGALKTTNPQAGVNQTGFVSKISADGTKLLASSYLGGTGSGTGDQPNGAAVDSSGDTIVVGTATNATFPMSSTGYQKTLPGPSACFILKLSADEKTIVAGTFLGGTGNVPGNGDTGQAVALDASQNIAVAGAAVSENFPVTAGAFQLSNTGYSGATYNAYYSKVSSNCTELLASTFLGGSSGDSAGALYIDSSGNAIVGGYTYSSDFPVTGAAFQSKFTETTGAMAFVSKISADAKTLMGSTYLGGSTGTNTSSGPSTAVEEGVSGTAEDSFGNLVVAGFTFDGDFPITVGAFQSASNGFINNDSTGFVAKLTADCTQMLAGTYLGGSGGDYINGLVLDSSGNPVVAGNTLSSDYPVTTGAYQTSPPGGGDGFITDLSFPPIALLFSPDDVAGGLNGTGKVILPTPAGSSGVTVTLSSDTPSLVGVPTSVKVPASQYSVSFPITTSPVLTSSTAMITAKVGTTYTQSAPFTVDPPALMFASFTPSTVVGGNSSNCEVVLGSPAPDGLVVICTGSGPIPPAPAYIPFATGASTYTFAVPTFGVAATSVATLNFSLSEIIKSASVTVTPASYSTFTETSTSVVGGANQSATVGLNGDSGPAGVVVTFAVTGPVWPVATRSFVERATLPVVISTQPVSVATAASVTAKIGAVSKTINFIVTPSPIASINVPASVLGGNPVTCIVNLAYPAGPSGDTVTLAGTGSWTVPASEPVAAGKTSVSFTIPSKAVSASAAATITATLGTSTVKATTTIAEAGVAYMIILPPSVIGGTSAFGIVSLSGPAGPTGDIVKLSGAGPWTLAPSVTVPAGQSGAYFVVTTTKVTATTSAKITATLGTSSVAASLTVAP